MLELGRYEHQGHEMIGIRAAEVADVLITVGQRAKVIAKAAIMNGMAEEQITEVDATPQAVDVLRQQLNPEDVVLIKGSRGMHMDAITPALEKVQ
jgi:UDP-N-acetylmuramoyl-tripeptide--D-alanyl-D-alanine ligase